MRIKTLQELPEEVKDFVFSPDITEINTKIEDKFNLNNNQISFIVNLESALFLKDVFVLNLPTKLEGIENADKLDLRKIALEIAYKILWPLQDYLGKVDRLILRLGGKVPRLKHLRKTVLQHKLFSDNDTDTIKNLLKKYEDFKDLRLSYKKIINKDNRKVIPSIDNWIKDYIHFLGGKDHDSLQRSKYLAKSKNILSLNKEEKNSMIEFLMSYDKDVIVDVESNNAVLKVSKHIRKEKETKKEEIKIDIDNVLEKLHQDLLDIEKIFLPSDYVLSEVDNDISKVGNVLWDAIGLDDSEKILACLKILIEKSSIDILMEEDKRFLSIFNRFITVRYGNDVVNNFNYKDKLLNSRIFLEMILVDKLKSKKSSIIAYYLTNLIKGSGQVVYLDEVEGILKWRELYTINNQLSFLESHDDNININKEKKVENIDNVLEKLHQDLLDIEIEILPSNYLLLEVDNDISKVGNLLWDAIGLDNSEKILDCLKILIERKSIDRLIEEDKRFQNILKNFVTVRYGNNVANNFDYKDKLLNRRIFLEMILVDKLKSKKSSIIAYYLTNLIKGSGQVVYLDEVEGTLKWRELYTINNQLVWTN